jgi:uncharacterized protein (DUF4415 family)
VNKPRTPPVVQDDDEDDVDLSNLGPDDAPELTPEMMKHARHISEIPEEARFWEFIRNGGRPRLPGEPPPRRVTILLDPDVIEHFKAGGRGWQTRINAALRKAAGLDD